MIKYGVWWLIALGLALLVVAIISYNIDGYTADASLLSDYESVLIQEVF